MYIDYRYISRKDIIASDNHQQVIQLILNYDYNISFIIQSQYKNYMCIESTMRIMHRNVFINLPSTEIPLR